MRGNTVYQRDSRGTSKTCSTRAKKTNEASTAARQPQQCELHSVLGLCGDYQCYILIHRWFPVGTLSASRGSTMTYVIHGPTHTKMNSNCHEEASIEDAITTRRRRLHKIMLYTPSIRSVPLLKRHTKLTYSFSYEDVPKNNNTITIFKRRHRSNACLKNL